MFTLASLLALPLICFLEGWQVSTMWSWFVVPLGLPAIGFAHAVGICSLLDAIRGDYPKGEIKTYQDLGRQVSKTLYAMANVWIVGFVAHILMGE